MGYRSKHPFVASYSHILNPVSYWEWSKIGWDFPWIRSVRGLGVIYKKAGFVKTKISSLKGDEGDVRAECAQVLRPEKEEGTSLNTLAIEPANRFWLGEAAVRASREAHCGPYCP